MLWWMCTFVDYSFCAFLCWNNGRQTSNSDNTAFCIWRFVLDFFYLWFSSSQLPSSAILFFLHSSFLSLLPLHTRFSRWFIYLPSSIRFKHIRIHTTFSPEKRPNQAKMIEIVWSSVNHNIVQWINIILYMGMFVCMIRCTHQNYWKQNTQLLFIFMYEHIELLTHSSQF